MRDKNTKHRQAILEVLKRHTTPLSAREVHARLPKIDLVTIYRNLEYFTKKKLIKKLRLGTQEARFEYQQEPHYHAICTTCNRIIHFTTSEKKLKKLLTVKGFKITELELTARGICNHT